MGDRPRFELIHGFGDDAGHSKGSADPSSDDGLRVALVRMEARPTSHAADWEAIGTAILSRARRDSRLWQRHAAEYQSAYVGAAIELLTLNPMTVVNARSPWGLVVSKGRMAGQRAVGEEVSCGLTDRDPVSHHVRFANVPRVVSLDHLIESTSLHAL